MKLKLLRLRARSLGLDPSGTREEIEARIIENSRNSVPKIPQNNCQPHYSLSDEISDNFMSEEEPNLLPNMMMNMEISEKNEEKSRVSAFERIKNQNEKTGISKRYKKKKVSTNYLFCLQFCVSWKYNTRKGSLRGGVRVVQQGKLHRQFAPSSFKNFISVYIVKVNKIRLE